ncbi:MAG: hypothetical protein V1790_17475 [Planctomycetota bacterium]
MWNYDALIIAGSDSAAVNINALGPTTVVAGVAGKCILLVSGILVGTAANSITLEDTLGEVYGGPMPFAANGGVAIPYCPIGAIKKLPLGTGLVIGSSVATPVGGIVSFIRIPG